MATLKTILKLSSIALLISACGAKKQLGYYNTVQNTDPRYSQVNAAGTFAGSLPQIATTVQNTAVPTQITSNQPVATNLAQTAQNFGYLNNCYRTILQQGNSYFQSGVDAHAVFQGAGQALVKCYNDVIQTQKMQQQQWQAYINSVYQQNYINMMYAAYQNSQQTQNQAAQFIINRPPGAR